MPLLILRCVFLMVAVGIGATLATRFQGDQSWWLPGLVFVSVVFLAVGVVLADLLIRRKQLDTISAVYFGTIVGAFLSYALALALNPILPQDVFLRDSTQLILAMVLMYLCTSLLLQTRNDFRFVIPYVEFVREVKGLAPYILDTSVIMDGRIADVVESGVLDRQLIAPQFIVAELQSIADSSDRTKRNRGRRGLSILNELRESNRIDLQIYERDLPELHGEPVDSKLVLLAKHLGGKLITNDYNLNKVARLHGVEVINLNDLANSLKPAYIPGDELTLRILKEGEQPGQGVGYLDDGTMVVVEGAQPHVHQDVDATVTSTTQTSAGRMIFARMEGAEGSSISAKRTEKVAPKS